MPDSSATDGIHKTTVSRFLLSAAAFVVVVAGMREANALLVPLLLAAFLAVILTPILRWLQRRHVPTALAILIIMAAIGLLGLGVAALAGNSINDFSDPQKQEMHRATFRQRGEQLKQLLRDYGVEMPLTKPETAGNGTADPGTNDTGGSEQKSSSRLSPEAVLPFAKAILAEMGNLLTNALVILVTVIFMLLEASRLPAKLKAIFGSSIAAGQHADIIDNIRRYVAIKTGTSALTGILVAIYLSLIGIDYAILWGLFAFMFNFVPNIGSIMAAIPPVLLAFIQPESGVATAVYVVIGYVVINGFISYLVEPRFMSQGLGLSTLVVFLSLIFWGWVLGPVGMLLSAPLTMIVKIILADFDETRWIAVLMGSKAPDGSTIN